jgi:hypothetical protein
MIVIVTHRHGWRCHPSHSLCAWSEENW